MPAEFTLTIVIPAYNEEKRLPGTLRTIYQFLAERNELGVTEVIIADDGSADATTDIVRQQAQSWPQLRLLSLSHHGKGGAIKAGALAAQGKWIFFCDADLSTPIEELPKFLPPHGPHADIVIGSRELPGARRLNEPLYRHIMGRVFNYLIQFLVLRGISDTQCGFKCLTYEAAHYLCTQQELNGMSFDVELLAIAKAVGFSIAEIPVLWIYESNSRVRPIQDTIAMFRDILRIRKRLRHFNPTANIIAPVELIHDNVHNKAGGNGWLPLPHAQDPGLFGTQTIHGNNVRLAWIFCAIVLLGFCLTIGSFVLRSKHASARVIEASTCESNRKSIR